MLVDSSLCTLFMCLSLNPFVLCAICFCVCVQLHWTVSSVYTAFHSTVCEVCASLYSLFHSLFVCPCIGSYAMIMCLFYDDLHHILRTLHLYDVIVFMSCVK